MDAYILIGGRSRRMGASKTELFLDRVLDAARPVFDEVLAVQRASGETARIPTIVEEPHAGEGAIFGVVAALRHARAACFVLAVDYPFVTPEALRYILGRGGVPVWEGHPQPLCAVWPAELLTSVEERISARTYDLRTIGDREMIPEAELRARFGGEVLMNINTPEDWKRGQGFFPSR